MAENIRPTIRLLTRSTAWWCLLCLFLCNRCLHAQPNLPVAAPISAEDLEFFEAKIRPLLIARCYECHSGNELNGGLSVESREQLLLGGDSGPAIELGEQHTESLLVQAVRYDNQQLQMPPSGRLSQEEIKLLEEWLARGLPDPRQRTEINSKPQQRLGLSVEDGRQFWSFRPVGNPSLPTVSDTSWVNTPIDLFILTELEQRGIAPAPPADKRTLIRRVTMDLTGLPPTPEEVQQFIDDSSAQAYPVLVERLLASPQYGVRWGRHWLDVARYADSNGLDENLALGTAWRYRDYVVKAFNQDKPYDRFIIEQIAGDLLPEANADTRTATGFLALGAKVLAEPDVQKLMMDTIDEQIDTMGKAVLGLSLGCSRCHDHKFDPITQNDYYALAAIFKGTRTFADETFGAIKYWYEHSFSTDEEKNRLKAIDAQIAAANQAAANYKNEAVAKIRQAAKERAADYLMAAARLPVGASLVEVTAVAEPLTLHPRILHHCRTHIENQRLSPFYKAFFELKERPEAVGQHYREIFIQVEAALEKARQSEPSRTTLDEPDLELARKERDDPAAMLAIPPQPQYALDAQALAEYDRLMEVARVIESQAEDYSSAMGVVDARPVHQLPIHIRGSHLNMGEPVARNLPEVFHASTHQPIFTDVSSGRTELAQWLASTTNPLTARVMVNRVWGWHFGRPLVPSTENFGLLGDRPTHPELLDWLARRWMQMGWSFKQLHRLIVYSSTYRMDSTHHNLTLAESIDAENSLLWKFPIQRLDAEQLRDAVLAVSDHLDSQLEGKSVPLRNRQFVFNHTSVDHTRYESVRRALYLPIIRNNLYTLFEQFDFPDPTMPTGHRNETTVAPQSLLMMNNELIMDSAGRLASRLLHEQPDPDQRLEQIFLRMFARQPTQSERHNCQEFIATVSQSGWLDSARVSPEVELQAWTVLVQSLMATNDFLYVR